MAVADVPVVMVQPVAQSTTQESPAKVRANQNRGRCATASMVVGAINIAIGLFSFVYQLARLEPAGVTHAGIWGGIFIMATGIVGVASGRTQKQGLIVASMILSILSCIMYTIIMPIMMAIDSGLVKALTDSTLTNGEIAAVLGILAFGGFATTLTSSIMACVELCCVKKPEQSKFVLMSPESQPVELRVVKGNELVISDVQGDSTYTSLQRSPNNPAESPRSPPHHAQSRSPTVRSSDEIEPYYTEIPDVVSGLGEYIHPPQDGQDYDGYELMQNPDDDGSYLKPISAKQLSQPPLPPTHGNDPSTLDGYANIR